MDIYKDEEREHMLKEDEITAVESAFMAGREKKVRERKRLVVGKERIESSLTSSTRASRGLVKLF